jgi:hypothetical protein
MLASIESWNDSAILRNFNCVTVYSDLATAAPPIWS